MTREEVLEIKARAEAASSGPWEHHPKTWSTDARVTNEDDTIAAFSHVYPEGAIGIEDGDAAFIAAARQDVPALCDALLEMMDDYVCVRAEQISPNKIKVTLPEGKWRDYGIGNIVIRDDGENWRTFEGKKGAKDNDS